MPLSELNKLISYARKKEEIKFKADLEKRLFPLWLSNYIATKIKGEECIEYDEFINSTLIKPNMSFTKRTPQKEKRTSDDILAEFMPLINADRERRRQYG